MPLFKFENGKAKRISQKSFSNEKELHELIDGNLTEVFNIRYIKDEHITDKHGRIETLAIDEANRPVVIEYKKIKETGQLTQANRYLTWISQNPDSFEKLVKKNIEDFSGEIDFANPRIICFAQEYSIDDKCLALPLKAELWKYRYYENDTMTIIREEEPEQLIRSKKTGKTTIEKINREPMKAKTIEEHLAGASDQLRKFFEDIDNRILQINDEIDRYTTNAEIIYKTSVNFVYISIQKNALSLLLRSQDGQLSDPKKLTEPIPKTHGWGHITHKIRISPKENDYEEYVASVIDIIFQSYSATQ